MRRLLLAAAVLVPLAVVAAIVIDDGQVIDVDNYNAVATAPTSYINLDQCNDRAPLKLEWKIHKTSALLAAGTYKLFASSIQPYDQGENVNYCPEAPSTGTGTDVHAGLLGDQIARTRDIQDAERSGAEAARLANVDCTSDGGVVYICAHLYDGTRKGYASGRFEVQVAAPDPPAITAASAAGEDRVAVEWTRSTGGVQVDHYRAVAMDAAGAEVGWATTEGTSATISGLTLGTTYTIVVYAYSLGGNQSDASAPRMATPAPVLDFWEAYKTAGGTDDGGCASGGAGPLALLGVASLLLLRRRR